MAHLQLTFPCPQAASWQVLTLFTSCHLGEGSPWLLADGQTWMVPLPFQALLLLYFLGISTCFDLQQ